MSKRRSKESMFSVSVDGLRNLARRRSIAQMTLELVQNSLDAQSTQIVVNVTYLPRQRRRTLKIEISDNAPADSGTWTTWYRIMQNASTNNQSASVDN